MKLIINGGVGFLPKEKSFEGFIYHLLYSLCRLKHTDTFVFLSYDNRIPLPGNGIPAEVKIPFFAQPISTAWYNRKLSAFIKKEKPGIYISLNGKPISADITQMLIISEDTGNRVIKSVHQHIQIQQWHKIITSSGLMKQKLEEQGIAETNILVLPHAPNIHYQPVDWEKKETVKNKYTGGKEFFFMPATQVPAQNIINTLKAFSQFKKWQQSNMQLVIGGNPVMNKQTQQLLDTYRYRKDVLIMEKNTDEKTYTEILASAMAMIYLPAGEEKSILIAEAMQCGIPVITAPSALLREAGGDAVLYSDPGDIPHLAGEMVKLYKDEKFRQTLVLKGKERIMPVKEEIIMEKFWNYIQQVVTR